MKMVKVETIRPRMLSYNDAAKYLGIAVKTLRNWCARNAVNPFPVRPKKIGGKPLFDLRELDDYLDSLTHG